MFSIVEGGLCVLMGQHVKGEASNPHANFINKDIICGSSSTPQALACVSDCSSFAAINVCKGWPRVMKYSNYM